MLTIIFYLYRLTKEAIWSDKSKILKIKYMFMLYIIKPSINAHIHDHNQKWLIQISGALHLNHESVHMYKI